MGVVTLSWTGSELQFVGSTAYGEPVMVGGDADGAGAKPSDLLPLSLAACTAYDVVAILRKQRQRLVALTVEVTSVQDPDPPWTFRSIHTAFTLTGTIDERKAARAIDLAEEKYCAVAATLRSVVDLSHAFTIVAVGP
ncbi:MAG TPA: OsmC family protein [Actinomycetota bacterium]|nr:OsmC family protein [Actinomycetota bacterium]